MPYHHPAKILSQTKNKKYSQPHNSRPEKPAAKVETPAQTTILLAFQPLYKGL
jgi:hypothetical protein